MWYRRRVTSVNRLPRRPEGWLPPGPPPAGAQGRAELEPQADEELSYLCGDWRVFQKRKGHRWSLDDLVTAWVAVKNAPTATNAIDIGCGLGSVLLLVAFKLPNARVAGIEAQADRAEMARRSIAFNGVEARCTVQTGDLREAVGQYDLVTGTPPYFPSGSGTQSTQTHAAPCRFEHRGGVEAYLAAAARLLTPSGRFVMCASALERARIRDAAKAVGLSFISHLEVVPREGKPVLITVDEFSPQGAARADSVLTVRDVTNQWTAEFSALRGQMGLPPTAPTGGTR